MNLYCRVHEGDESLQVLQACSFLPQVFGVGGTPGFAWRGEREQAQVIALSRGAFTQGMSYASEYRSSEDGLSLRGIPRTVLPLSVYPATLLVGHLTSL